MNRLRRLRLAFFRCLAGGLLLATFQAHAEPEVPALSPALRQWLAEALRENPGVQAARAAVEAAEARLRAASRPLYNPELELEAEQAETRSGTLGLSQAIDWADKRAARRRVAESELARVRAEYAEARRKLAGELLAALARFHTAKALDALAGQRQALMQRFVDLARKRHEAGDLNQVELDLARLAYTQVRLERAQAQTELAEAEQALVALTGRMRTDWPALPTRLPGPGPFDVEALLARLPTVQAARAAIEAARGEVTLRTRERRPDPTLGLRAGQERAFRGGDNDRFGVVGLSLSVPLFVRNDFRAEVEAAGAGLAQAERNLQEILRQARARILSAAERYRLGREAWRTWTAAGEASLESQLQLLERFWRVGELSSADYLVQLNQTLDTRVTAHETLGRLWTAWADWLRASGRIERLIAGEAAAE